MTQELAKLKLETLSESFPFAFSLGIEDLIVNFGVHW
jgi:hypothetical protein